MKSTKSQRVRSGIFVLIGGGLLLIVLVIFGGLRLWHSSHRYPIYFGETVYGLENGGAVYFEGVRVGSVDALAIAHAGEPGRVRAEIEVDDDTPIRAGTKAYLTYAGITGVKEIDLRGGVVGEPVLAPGMTIAVGETELDKLEDQISAMTARAGTLLDNLSKTADNLAKLTDPNGAVAANAQAAAANLASAADALNKMITENRAALRASLASVDRAATSASSFAARADDLVGQLDSLVRANGGQLRSTVADLAQASRSFKELVRDLRQSPSRLLFSKAPRERKLP